MKRILSFGSVNIDHVYTVDHFVRPGETIAAASYAKYSGGKGFNQSTALARAGATVFHAGLVGEDGIWLRDALRADGADVSFLKTCGSPTGHAIIQVDQSGQNNIIIEGGANQAITAAFAREVLQNFGEGDVLLLQNEISSIAEIMKIAMERKISIAFNPAPMNKKVLTYPLDLVSLFIVNEIEGAELSGCTSDNPDEILSAMRSKFPTASIVLTLGSRGAIALDGKEKVFVPAEKVKTVDTTAAGDTFTGYFLASRLRGESLEAAMRTATHASAICVSAKGAAPSIPRLFKAAIIDLDGVMLDSLGVWGQIDTDFVKRYNIKNGDEVVLRLQRTTSLLEAGVYLHNECGHPHTPEAIAQEFTDLLGGYYRNSLQLFPGVIEKLQEFKRNGVKIAMVTASPEVHAKPAAERTGIMPFFSKVYYDEKKTTREIFDRAAADLGASAADTIVIDDNPLLRAVAESAGFRTLPSLV